MNNTIQLKQSDVKRIREEILKDQGNRCALCGTLITDSSKACLDHQHMTSKEKIGKDGAGLVRGVLCNGCNLLEGKFWNNTARFRQAKSVSDRIEILEALIKYYNKENYPLIHPNEAVKEPLLKKNSYNKLRRVYKEKARFPEYPKSGRMTKKLSVLFEKYSIEPEYYS